MTDDDRLELALSEPTEPLVETMARLPGDLVVLGAGGKMGPSLVRLALRASEAAGTPRRIIAVSRFQSGRARERLERAGATVLGADLLSSDQVDRLPDAPNVIFMAGQKFGTDAEPGRTWVVNTVLPSLVARRYRASRIVVFSSGNVYPFWPVDSAGPTESDPLGPVGEYAQSIVGRERVFEYFAREHGTPLAILRLNYAIEPRYGVLRDLADRVRGGTPIDLAVGAVNVIWQSDANAVAIRALEHAAVPPLVLNLTGHPAVTVRAIALAFGRRFGVEPRFAGPEGPTALLSDARAAIARFGPPPTGLDSMIERVAAWIEAGGPSLGKPTRFDERSGRF
jgi:nucleoside-diphosphate-sugar epimerase